ncbi:MAG: cell wall hydrolase [Lachnospiraceae bacterium]|nr:cell wall hydrolase [Lachnospiraceae bacterium]
MTTEEFPDLAEVVIIMENLKEHAFSIIYFIILGGFIIAGIVVNVSTIRDLLKEDEVKKVQNTVERKDYTVEKAEEEVKKIEVPEVSENGIDTRGYSIIATSEEVDLMARVVMSESADTDSCRRAVAEVILNRLDDEDFPDTIHGVVYQKNQFSTGYNGKPTGECYEAVHDALKEGMYPDDMFWFREDYVDYGNEYTRFENLVFSTETKY